MSDDSVQCPDCLTRMPESALFCPGCGRPRTQVSNRLKVAADRMGIPYDVLLERVRNGSLHLSSLPSAHDNRSTGAAREGRLVLLVLAALFVSGVVWAAGGEWLVVAGLIVWLAVAFGRAQSRVEVAEERIHTLEDHVTMLITAAPSTPAVTVPEPPPAPQSAPATDRVVDEVVGEGPQVVPVPVETPPSSVTPLSEPVPTPAADALASPLSERDRDPAEAPPEPQPTQPSRDPWWSGDLEQLLSGRILAWVGGLAIMVGAVFFLSLAFSRGWIGPGLRVLTGVAVSALMIGGGAWFFERRERVFGHVLVSVGLGIMSVSMLAATALYDLIPSAAGLAGTLVVALAAALIAVRADSQVVAIFGLVAALAAPPLQDAPVTGTTVAFLAFVLCGTTAIALYRSWSWLPPIAFLLAAPQMAVWVVDDASIPIGLLALSGFWLLNAIAAGGEEYRLRDATRMLRPVSATLLLANVAFLVWGGFTLLEGDAEGGRGLFLVLVALAHAAIAGWFFRTEGDRHPFGLLAAGTGIAAFTIAIPIQLGGPAVPIAWAAEAVALTWVATLRRHPYSAAMATILGFGAIGYLGLFAYPFWQFGGGDVAERPFLNASGGTLIFILGALLVAGVISRWRDLRLVLGGVGFALLIYAMPFELSGIALLAGWSLLFVLAWTSDQWLERLPGFGDDTRWDQGFEPVLRRLLLLPAGISGALAGLHALVFELPLIELPTWTQPETPFWTEQTAAALILIAACLVAVYASRSWIERHAGITIAFAVAAYLMPFELEPAPMLLAWSALALAQLALPKVAPAGLPFAVVGGSALVALGFLVTLGTTATPTQLLSNENGATPFWSEATATLGALAGVLGIAFWLHRTMREARIFALGALAILSWLIPIELGAAGSVIGWFLLVVLLMLLDRWPVRETDVTRDLAQLGAVLLLGFAGVATLVLVVPPSRLFVDEEQGIDHPFFWSSATATLGVLAGVLAFATWLYRTQRPATWAANLCGVTIVYLLSVGVVDIFQGRVGGQVAVEALQKQAQVALSILWTVLGVGLFVGGIIRRLRVLRIGGLALLGLSTAKVFVYDLASLDSASCSSSAPGPTSERSLLSYESRMGPSDPAMRERDGRRNRETEERTQAVSLRLSPPRCPGWANRSSSRRGVPANPSA